MHSYQDHLKYFHGGLHSPQTELSYDMETKVDAALSKSSRYLLDVRTLQDIQEKFLEEQRSSTIPGVNPNSSKEIAQKISLLHLGITIPQTAKGNVSITKEWLESISSQHPLLQQICQWRNASKKLSIIETMKKNTVQENNQFFLTAKWRTFSESGSGRIVAEAFPMDQLSNAFKPAIVAPTDQVWLRIKFPDLTIRMLAFLAKDTALQDAISSESLPTFFSSEQPTYGQYFNKLIYDYTQEFDIEQPQPFPYTLSYLSDMVQQAGLNNLIMLPHGRVRDLSYDPKINRDNFELNVINSIVTQSSHLYMKEMIALLLLATPMFSHSTWLPRESELYVTMPASLILTLSPLIEALIRSQDRAWGFKSNATFTYSTTL